MTKNDEEKPSGIWNTMKSAAGSLLGLTGRGKEEGPTEGTTDMDVDSMGPVIEDREEEELSEVVFQSLLESCPDDQFAVRSVIIFVIFRSSVSI